MDEIELNGRTYRVQIEGDYDHGAPWDEEDGHGPVSDWTTRKKLPGELVLSQDRDRYRYYNFAEACRIALAEGWDAKPYNTGQQTKRQQAAKAARADFDRLRQWCDDQWCYVGVIVTEQCNCCGDFSGESSSLWGIESDSYDYLGEVAQELAEELAARHQEAA